MKQQDTELIKQQQEDEMEIDLLEIFYLLKSKLAWLILSFILGGVIMAAVTIFLITPKYTATAKIYMVSASSESVLNLSDLNLGTSLSQDYSELIKIRPVFNEVIENLGLDMEYEELLEKVTINTIGDTRLLSVSVEDEDPKEAQRIVNELADTAVTYIPKVMETSTPNIAEYAIVPKKPSSPSLFKNTIIGALVFLLLTAAAFICRMLMDDSLNTAEDVEKAFGIMPFTVIPEGELQGISDEVEERMQKRSKKAQKARKKAEKKQKRKKS